MTKPPKPKPLLKEAGPPLRSRRLPGRDASQPHLALDPMPVRVEPCLAQLRQKPPKGEKWAFEIKWDGYRLAVHLEPDRVRIITRGGHDWTHRFPAIAAAAKSLGVTAILDGEAVVFDEEGRSSFSLLQQSLGGRGGSKATADAVFMAFDLLYLDGHDLTGVELSTRRHLLKDLIPAQDSKALLFSEEMETDGATLIRLAREQGLEGIIAKDRDSLYRSGRQGDWLKIKCIESDSFLVIGWEPSARARGQIGALLLAAYHGSELVHVGSVGTGIKATEAVYLRDIMSKFPAAKTEVAGLERRKGVNWVQPTLIAEIDYRGWTGDMKLRHASYKGLREFQDNAAVCQLVRLPVSGS